MAVFAVTNTFQAGSTITASGHNTNWSDVTTWLNNRYSGSDTWLFMKVSGTDANPADITSSAAATELSLNNTASDGDPLLTFKLSGSQTHVIGVDDSDSDFLKFATTGITTNVALQIPTTGAQIQLNAGTNTAPSFAAIGDSNTGMYFSAADTMNLVSGGNSVCTITATSIKANNPAVFHSESLGSAGAPSYSWSGDTNTGMFSAGANQVSLATAAAEVLRVDESAVARDTRLLIFDVDNNTLERVTVGIADSGGAGFKLLRIPN